MYIYKALFTKELVAQNNNEKLKLNMCKSHTYCDHKQIILN